MLEKSVVAPATAAAGRRSLGLISLDLFEVPQV